jgi:hypothetical protein
MTCNTACYSNFKRTHFLVLEIAICDYLSQIWFSPLNLEDLLFELILHSTGRENYFMLLLYFIWIVREKTWFYIKKTLFLWPTNQSEIWVIKHYRFILFETITKFSLFQKKVYGLVPTAEHKTLLDSLTG